MLKQLGLAVVAGFLAGMLAGYLLQIFHPVIAELGCIQLTELVKMPERAVPGVHASLGYGLYNKCEDMLCPFLDFNLSLICRDQQSVKLFTVNHTLWAREGFSFLSPSFIVPSWTKWYEWEGKKGMMCSIYLHTTAPPWFACWLGGFATIPKGYLYNFTWEVMYIPPGAPYFEPYSITCAPQSLYLGETVNISYSIYNRGEAGQEKVTIKRDQEVIATPTHYVPAKEFKQFSYADKPPATGNYTYTVSTPEFPQGINCSVMVIPKPAVTCTLRIDVYPADLRGVADVYVDGAYQGKAPLNYTAQVDVEYTVGFGDVSGYLKPADQKAKCTYEGQVISIVGKYTPAVVPATLLLYSNLEGTSYSITPAKCIPPEKCAGTVGPAYISIKLTPDFEYSVECSKPGYSCTNCPFKWKPSPGGSTAFACYMAPVKGRLVLRSNVEDTSWQVSNAEVKRGTVGTKPIPIDLTPGTYMLRCSKPGYYEYTASVAIESGGVSFADCMMREVPCGPTIGMCDLPGDLVECPGECAAHWIALVGMVGLVFAVVWAVRRR